MNDKANADTMQQMLGEITALRAKVAQLEARLTPVNLPAKIPTATLHRPFLPHLIAVKGRFGLALSLIFALMIVSGGLWAGSLQAQAQTNPKPASLASGPTVIMPKFCAGCDRSGNVFPANFDLSNAYLAGTNYSNATLSNATLSNAYLTGVIFDHATLTGADLTGAILYGATLTGADLTGADLTGAILYGASLSSANFSGATLKNVDLSSTTFDTANFSQANLTDANLTGGHGIPSDVTGVTWSNTICPDATNTNTNGGTCTGHWIV